MSQAIILAGVAMIAAAAAPVPSLRKVGGLWFLRLGRFRASFCLVRETAR